MKAGTTGLARQIRREGYRLTPQRVAIIEALASLRGHPSAEEVYEGVRRRLPTVSLATVYKTLSLLRRLGHLQELRTASEAVRFETAPTLHPHLVCLACGRVEDTSGPEDAGSLLHHLGLAPSWRVSGYRLDLLGLCPHCAERGVMSPGLVGVRSARR